MQCGHLFEYDNEKGLLIFHSKRGNIKSAVNYFSWVNGSRSHSEMMNITNEGKGDIAEKNWKLRFLNKRVYLVKGQSCADV